MVRIELSRSQTLDLLHALKAQADLWARHAQVSDFAADKAQYWQSLHDVVLCQLEASNGP